MKINEILHFSWTLKKHPQGPTGRPKARAESAQGPSGTLPSTPGDALGGPKAAYELSKDLLNPL